MKNKYRIAFALLALLLLLGCTAAAEESWICPGCGKECHGNVCGNCGTVKPVWFCPVCMTENAGKYCTNCGWKKPDGNAEPAPAATEDPQQNALPPEPAGAGAPVEITGIRMEEDGSVHVAWTGGEAPYTVSYRRAADAAASTAGGRRGVRSGGGSREAS